jgi:hypothetical protein
LQKLAGSHSPRPHQPTFAGFEIRSTTDSLECLEKVAGGRKSLFGRLRHAGQDHVIQRLRQVWTSLDWRRGCVCDMTTHDGEMAITIEGLAAGYQLVQHDAE